MRLNEFECKNIQTNNKLDWALTVTRKSIKDYKL